MEWMHNCFKLEMKYYFCGNYQILIVDRYTSHVSTKYIQFVHKHTIVCLCLPAYFTLLLQLLDVGVFSPLKQNYKTLLAKKTRFTTYNMDKANFILLIQKA